MLEIYCAFNSEVNRKAWGFKQGHIVKIGHTDPSLETSRIDVFNHGWPPKGKKRSMPLAAESQWNYKGEWPVKYGRSDTRILEGRVRQWFRRRCGVPVLIEKLRPLVLKDHVELNGLTELVCVDLAKIGQNPYIASKGCWTYPETPDLIRKVIGIVRANEVEWRRLASADAD